MLEIIEIVLINGDTYVVGEQFSQNMGKILRLGSKFMIVGHSNGTTFDSPDYDTIELHYVITGDLGNTIVHHSKVLRIVTTNT